MAKTKHGSIRIGVGGWTYAPWRGVFYPAELTQKRELEYASRHLASIEINGTYYGLQKPATFAKWHDETPDGFVFSLKAPRFVVNRNVLAEAGNSISRFLASGLTRLKDKLGPINWQFLPAKQFDAMDFEAFLKLLPKEQDGWPLRHAVEVRNASFRSPAFVALAREYGVAVVIAGDSEHPQIADLTAPFVYARIMGTEKKAPAGYSARALDVWATRAKAWASGRAVEGLVSVEGPKSVLKPRDLYLYVISGHKVSNPAAAVALIQRIDRD
jgi:uncharacterized protein YecE (DUF72 family)